MDYKPIIEYGGCARCAHAHLLISVSAIEKYGKYPGRNPYYCTHLGHALPEVIHCEHCTNQVSVFDDIYKQLNP